MPALPAASSAKLLKDLQYLTQTIGVRLAGSDAEKAAAAYVKNECEKCGAVDATEFYPVVERCVTSEKLEVLINGKWESFPASLFGAAPTTDGRTIEAELVMFDVFTGYLRDDLSFLTGKAVVHLGSHIDSPEKYARLMQADPAFILMVDTRFPSDVPKADGLFPDYVKKFGARPTMDVPYLDAVKWASCGATRARLTVCGGTRNSQTPVVVADLPGSEPDSGIIYLGSHLDTQAGTVGADDNAAGCAAGMELIKILSQVEHRHTIRFCAFGAEEQLSVGAAAYVRAHREEIAKRGVYMVNFDGGASALGWNTLRIVSTPEVIANWDKIYRRHDEVALINAEPTPFLDNFAFHAAGIPGVCVSRENCNNGVFYHHRADNTIDNLDPAKLAKLVDIAADFIIDFDQSPDSGIPESLREPIAKLWEQVYGGWQ